jgi:hypothetical protein
LADQSTLQQMSDMVTDIRWTILKAREAINSSRRSMAHVDAIYAKLAKQGWEDGRGAKD